MLAAAEASVHPSDRRLIGGAGADLLAGGGGDDVLFGGPGRDALAGGTGDDVLDVQDEGPDDLACGEGVDRVGNVIIAGSDDPIGDEYTTVDAKDEIAQDCEREIFPDPYGDSTYRTTYRTMIAVPPATGQPRRG